MSANDHSDDRRDAQASVFISYNHADRPVAQALAAGLKSRDYFVWLDEGELRVGDSLIERLAEAVSQVDFLLALVSKHSVRSAWCQREVALAMTDEVQGRVVKVMPLRIDDTPLPDTLRDKIYREVDRTRPDDVVAVVAADIVAHLAPPRTIPSARRGRGAPADSSPSVPAPGLTPQPVSPTPGSPEFQPATGAGPVRIIDVDRDGVGTPRNDGSPGSGLYRVPLRLNVSPDPKWVERFVQNWDHPPHFTLMHRTGIASVQGDRIVLDGTTLEEIADVHQETLKEVVRQTNMDYENERRRGVAIALRRQAELEARRHAVDEAAGRIDFS